MVVMATEQIHRRKIRVWQMICVLTQFVCDDIVEQVTHSLRVSLHVSKYAYTTKPKIADEELIISNYL